MIRLTMIPLTCQINEVQGVVQDSLVWPCDELNRVTIRTTGFKSLTKGQCLIDTMVDFYLK